MPVRSSSRFPSAPRRYVVGMLLIVACLASACSVAPGSGVRTPYDQPVSNLEKGPAYEIKIGNVSGLGEVLVDGQGMTVYLFATDHQGRPSSCVSLCAVEWPPVILPPGTHAPIAGPGIQTSLLGTSPRADGSTQITYNGRPLYTWPQDTAPGEATGQALTNLGGRWYVMNAAGNAIHAY